MPVLDIKEVCNERKENGNHLKGNIVPSVPCLVDTWYSTARDLVADTAWWKHSSTPGPTWNTNFVAPEPGQSWPSRDNNTNNIPLGVCYHTISTEEGIKSFLQT